MKRKLHEYGHQRIQILYLSQHRLQILVFNPDNDDISAKAWMNLVDLGKQAAGKRGGVDNWSNEVRCQ